MTLVEQSNNLQLPGQLVPRGAAEYLKRPEKIVRAHFARGNAEK